MGWLQPTDWHSRHSHTSRHNMARCMQPCRPISPFSNCWVVLGRAVHPQASTWAQSTSSSDRLEFDALHPSAVCRPLQPYRSVVARAATCSNNQHLPWTPFLTGMISLNEICLPAAQLGKPHETLLGVSICILCHSFSVMATASVQPVPDTWWLERPLTFVSTKTSYKNAPGKCRMSYVW